LLINTDANLSVFFDIAKLFPFFSWNLPFVYAIQLANSLVVAPRTMGFPKAWENEPLWRWKEK